MQHRLTNVYAAFDYCLCSIWCLCDFLHYFGLRARFFSLEFFWKFVRLKIFHVSGVKHVIRCIVANFFLLRIVLFLIGWFIYFGKRGCLFWIPLRRIIENFFDSFGIFLRWINEYLTVWLYHAQCCFLMYSQFIFVLLWYDFHAFVCQFIKFLSFPQFANGIILQAWAVFPMLLI